MSRYLPLFKSLDDQEVTPQQSYILAALQVRQNTVWSQKKQKETLRAVRKKVLPFMPTQKEKEQFQKLLQKEEPMSDLYGNKGYSKNIQQPINMQQQYEVKQQYQSRIQQLQRQIDAARRQASNYKQRYNTGQSNLMKISQQHQNQKADLFQMQQKMRSMQEMMKRQPVQSMNNSQKQQLRLLQQKYKRLINQKDMLEESLKRTTNQKKDLADNLQKAIQGSIKAQIGSAYQAQNIIQKLKKSGIDKSSNLEVQVKKKIRKQYFSAQAIQIQKKIISTRIFYYPSQQLARLIQNRIGSDVQSTIYKCCAFKHADLVMLKATNSSVKKQIVSIMEKIIPWGTFFIDIQGLQTRATNIIGSIDDSTYNMSQYDIMIRISKKGITFKYKDKVITPNQMKNTVLKQMALQSLYKKATKMYFQFLKMSQNMF